MIVKVEGIAIKGAPKGGLKSCFHAGFSDKSRPDIAWNSCSCQVYPIALDARLIFHAITQLFSPNSCFHAMKYVQSRHHAFPLGVPSSFARLIGKDHNVRNYGIRWDLVGRANLHKRWFQVTNQNLWKVKECQWYCTQILDSVSKYAVVGQFDPWVVTY